MLTAESERLLVTVNFREFLFYEHFIEERRLIGPTASVSSELLRGLHFRALYTALRASLSLLSLLNRRAG